MAKENKKKAAAKNNTTKTVSSRPFVFGAENYKLLILSFLIVTIGFILMWGKEDIFDSRKVTLAPIVVMSGFVLGIYSILKGGKKETQESKDSEA